MDEDLLEDRPALAAEPTAEATRRAARRRCAAWRIVHPPAARHVAAGALELRLERLEDVPDERACPGLEVELGGGEGEVHRPPRMRHARTGRATVAGRGTARRTAPGRR